MSMSPLLPPVMAALPVNMPLFPSVGSAIPTGQTPASPLPVSSLSTSSLLTDAGSASSQKAGEIFDGKGDSFLDPSAILREVNGFANALPSKDPGPFGKNPDPSKIVSTTTQSLARILKGPVTFQNIPIPILPGPFPFPIPNLSNNPDAAQIGLSTLFFINNLLPPRPSPIVNNPPPSTRTDSLRAVLQLLQQLLNILQVTQSRR